MYVELHNYQELEQKVLFFKLKTVLNLDNSDAVDLKKAGIYIIYKDDICLYVGQSSNLASRLATHIKGKYAEATKIYLLDIENIGWSDFKKRTKETQAEILIDVEKYVMSVLNPIENILISHDIKTPDDMIPLAEISKNYIEYSYIINMNRQYQEDTLLIKSQDGMFDYFKESLRIDVDLLKHNLNDCRDSKNETLLAFVSFAKGVENEINK